MLLEDIPLGQIVGTQASTTSHTGAFFVVRRPALRRRALSHPAGPLPGWPPHAVTAPFDAPYRGHKELVGTAGEAGRMAAGALPTARPLSEGPGFLRWVTAGMCLKKSPVGGKLSLDGGEHMRQSIVGGPATSGANSARFASQFRTMLSR